MVYKDQDSAFIRCHDFESNNEYIHILQHDGTISNGIFRIRYSNWYTVIGSQYFRRSGREEGRVYQLYRFNKSGNIEYEDRILGKDGKRWRTLSKYRFNQETLDWTKLEVEQFLYPIIFNWIVKNISYTVKSIIYLKRTVHINNINQKHSYNFTIYVLYKQVILFTVHIDSKHDLDAYYYNQYHKKYLLHCKKYNLLSITIYLKRHFNNKTHLFLKKDSINLYTTKN